MSDLPLDVTISAGDCDLRATLTVPARPVGLVIIAHPAWFCDHRAITRVLQAHNVATLRVDLTGCCRIDPELRVARLLAVTEWARRNSSVRALPMAYLGVGDCATAALVAARRLPGQIEAVVTAGERHDVLVRLLGGLAVPSLLIGEDAAGALASKWQVADRHLVITTPAVNGRGYTAAALDTLARLADDWLTSHLQRATLEADRSRRNTMARPSAYGDAA